MSITIHHGANGSYKTSGVVQDYYIDAVKSGRVVVTNIRGISRDNTLSVFPDMPDSHDVIYIDTDSSEGRALIATWWHWVPLGALLLFDEAGVNFPKRWRESDLKAFNYPDQYDDGVLVPGIDAAAYAGRPYDWVEAWEKHRHYNWDIVLSAPNIKSLRDDIRNTTEGAYKHKNRAILGPLFKGSYKEGYHDATTNGASASDFYVIKNKRINKNTFRLYSSTKTGKHTETLNGFNLFSHPKILFMLGIALCSIGWAFYRGTPSIFTEKPPQAVSVVNNKNLSPDTSADFQSLTNAFDKANGFSGSGLSDRKNSISSNVNHPLSGFTAKITGYAYQPSADKYFYQFKISDAQESVFFSAQELEEYGYTLKPDSKCHAQLRYKGKNIEISCFTQTL
ncbi:zonular occludens toxin domain-containing protein [Neptunomonas phycophila]|uniref:zonular occludens toxin domain-containing protein n=1 Tax=Neptunomonas phycophila TaxID=1572645 RepID=UPI0026E145ED|nr:zonular occludens toxin domain-containing protein [Neptunomonas phycophila]MDO6785907.1 zonular occludens toxin domain-containing protein [Neptunomonas phycophila]